MRLRTVRFAVLPTVCAVAFSFCTQDRSSQREDLRADIGDSISTSAPASASADADGQTDLVDAATRVVRFLRGELPFDSIHLADTVSLHLGAEEGKTRRNVGRDMLRNRSNWSVYSESLRHSYSFLPPAGSAQLITRVGRHLNCRDYPLSATFPQLAPFPHVGTTLRYGNDSCLQTWNLTLVFDRQRRPPTLIAAVYDQFEW